MIRILISAIIGVHALIHLIGFAKEFNLGPGSKPIGKNLIPLSPGGLKIVGLLWLLTAVMLVVAGFAKMQQKEWFWQLGATSVVLSQVLIILYWRDAKWGTIGNIIILIIVIIAASELSFNRMVQREVDVIVSAPVISDSTINDKNINSLPPVVSKWLRKSNVVGKPVPRVISILQKGELRSTRESNWMKFEAEQHFTMEPAAFVWQATMHANSWIDIVARDKYEGGKGNMLIKAASIIPIANSSGKEIDQGSMLRYMAEIIWFPHAAISDSLLWEQIDDNHARVTMNNGSLSETGTFTFNKNGLPIAFDALRWGDFDGRFAREQWSINITGYSTFQGITIPSAADVTWKLADGDFTWLRLQILDATYH